MRLSVTVLGSGSQGNCVAVETGGKILLLDCGFPKVYIAKMLGRVGLNIEDVELCLITHRHLDHSRSSRFFNTKFFDDEVSTRTRWRGCEITPFDLIHSVPCVGFRIDCGEISIAYLVDFNEISEESLKYLLGLDLIIIESNYREEMIDEFDRFRKSGQHLSNKQAACILQTVACDRLKHVVLAHLSAVNNTPSFALRSAREAVPWADVIVAGQVSPTKTITIIK